MYLPCFTDQHHKVCPTRNIKWMHADIRCIDTIFSTNKKWHDFRKLVRYMYQKQKGKQVLAIEEIDMVYDDEPNHYETKLTEEQINDLITGYSNELNTYAKYVDYIENVLLLLFDTPACIDKVFEMPCISTLYENVDKRLYTKQSFIQLFEGYKNSVWDKDEIEECKEILKDLLKYFKGDDFNIIARMKWKSNIFNVLEYWSTLCLAGLMDIYFIVSLANNPTERYVFTLFGSNHCNNIVNYYTNTIKSHILTYHNESDKARITINTRIIPVGSSIVVVRGNYKGYTGKVVSISNDKYTVKLADYKTDQTKKLVLQRTYISNIDTEFRDKRRTRRPTVRSNAQTKKRGDIRTSLRSRRFS
jgi:ribosomal protein L21E